MTKLQFIDCAIRAGLVPSAAVDDAESYDGGATLHQLSVMWTAVCELKQDEPEAKPGAVKCPTCKRPFEEVSIRELVERQAESPVVPPQRDLDPESKRVLYGNMRELMEKSEPKTKLTMEEARNTICTGCGLTLYACQCPSENRQAKLPEEGNYGTD